MNSEYILVMVDCQYDFCNPNGSMYVNGAENALHNIKKLIGQEFDKIHSIVYTEDYHPENHLSFKAVDNEHGLWPSHCVQNSQGCITDASILKIADAFNIKMTYYRKGTNPGIEEYSGFLDKQKTLQTTTISDAVNLKIPVIVCGVAGDYCVIETAKTLRDIYDLDVFLYTAGIASINKETFEKQIKEENFIIYN